MDQDGKLSRFEVPAPGDRVAVFLCVDDRAMAQTVSIGDTTLEPAGTVVVVEGLRVWICVDLIDDIVATRNLFDDWRALAGSGAGGAYPQLIHGAVHLVDILNWRQVGFLWISVPDSVYLQYGLSMHCGAWSVDFSGWCVCLFQTDNPHGNWVCLADDITSSMGETHYHEWQDVLAAAGQPAIYPDYGLGFK